MNWLDAIKTKERISQLGLEKEDPVGFSFNEIAGKLRYSWHQHSRHQLIYALRGRVILESPSARWLLPPLRAAWIPAELPHRTALEKAEIITVFFSNVTFSHPEIQVLSASPLLKEMLVFSERWNVKTDLELSNAEFLLKESFFSLLSQMCDVWIQETLPFHLPRPKSARLERAVNFLLENLDSATVVGAAQASGQSERTLHRSMVKEMKMPWKEFSTQARLLEAMDRLVTTDASVLEIALAVGYNSPSAFAKAFKNFSGQTPLDFRQAGGNPHSRRNC